MNNMGRILGRVNESDTICWWCKNCGKCSWTDKSFTPIEGWKAEKVRHKTSNSDTYIVKQCPLFELIDIKYNEKNCQYSTNK